MMKKPLQWEQRITLVRHNLHTASRSGDFTFFKTLQAQAFLEGTNHVATLSAAMGDEADTLLSGLDDLNASIAYLHQDAFKNVYNGLKTHHRDDIIMDRLAERSKVYVDAIMQKQMADHSIDKMTSSAIALIQQQTDAVQETAANVWITGNTIIADCMEVCIKQIDDLENNMGDFIRLEESWNTVKASVGLSIAALKCVFSLMAADDNMQSHQESPFLNFAGGNVLRRLSSAFTGGSSPSSRRSSVSVTSVPARRDSIQSDHRTPGYLRSSVSSGMPTSMPPLANPFSQVRLDTIPPTPAVFDEDVNPFDTSFPMPPIPTLHITDHSVSQAVM